MLAATTGLLAATVSIEFDASVVLESIAMFDMTFPFKTHQRVEQSCVKC
jgi:hypothetical protein